MSNKSIPVIDLFAGPGGLGEGFSSYTDCEGENVFEIALSIEKDVNAQRTLELRAFFRQFEYSNVPPSYYSHLRGAISRDELFNAFSEHADKAKAQAWNAELGIIDASEVNKRIIEALGTNRVMDRWVLIGGPPCQAYSLVGRSRNAKTWKKNPEIRDSDPRHFLYQEYLRILVEHHPPVFIMENVKGLLSSRVSGKLIAELVFNDLSNPSLALGHSSKPVTYKLYSFVREPLRKTLSGDPYFDHKDFIIRCEDYGIPQARHRVIILGIRSDISAKPQILVPEQERMALKRIVENLPKIRSGISRGIDSDTKWKKGLKELINGILSGSTIDPLVFEMMNKEIESVHTECGQGGEFVPCDETAPYDTSDTGLSWLYDGRIDGYCNHHARSHMVSDLQRYFFAACFAKALGKSPKLCDFPVALLPNHANIEEGISGGKFSDRFRVQLPDRPATTVTSHISKDGHYFIHPDPRQCRSLTVREAARLQTFPDNYLFTGNQTSQYWQVGNAVPPLLARKLAAKVYELLTDAGLN